MFNVNCGREGTVYASNLHARQGFFTRDRALPFLDRVSWGPNRRPLTGLVGT
jgi:hypothetical protein